MGLPIFLFLVERRGAKTPKKKESSKQIGITNFKTISFGFEIELPTTNQNFWYMIISTKIDISDFDIFKPYKISFSFLFF